MRGLVDFTYLGRHARPSFSINLAFVARAASQAPRARAAVPKAFDVDMHLYYALWFVDTVKNITLGPCGCGYRVGTQ